MSSFDSACRRKNTAGKPGEGRSFQDFIMIAAPWKRKQGMPLESQASTPANHIIRAHFGKLAMFGSQLKPLTRITHVG